MISRIRPLLLLASAFLSVGALNNSRAWAEAQAAQEPSVLAAPSIPDVSLVDQDGRKVRFYSDLIEGKTVAVNFVFTSCSTICTPQGARFAELQRLLGPKVGSEVHLISVSIDPETDTPAKLKAWSTKLGAAPGWTLVTGGKEEVVRLLKSLGAFDVDIRRHTPSMLLGNDREKRWTRAYSLAPAAQLAGLLDALRPAADEGTKEGK